MRLDWFIYDMDHSYAWHGSFICVTWLIYTWDMTHSYVTWRTHICDITHPYVPWLIHMWHDIFICDMTHSYVTWLIHTWHDSSICDMTHSCVTWLVYMWHDSFIDNIIRFSWQGPSFSCQESRVMLSLNESCHIRMSHVTYEWVMLHMNESCHINSLVFFSSVPLWFHTISVRTLLPPHLYPHPPTNSLTDTHTQTCAGRGSRTQLPLTSAWIRGENNNDQIHPSLWWERAPSTPFCVSRDSFICVAWQHFSIVVLS